MRDKYILLIAMCAMLVVVVGLAYIMNDPEPEPVGDWESITADDVKFIVVETAMKVYRDGRMNEPREIHAQEACQLWFEHYGKPSRYWRDKINQAEHERMTNAVLTDREVLNVNTP